MTGTDSTKSSDKSSTTKAAVGNTAVPSHGDHDRVQMLSLKADGTPDQLNPEIIGDPETAKAAAREQFKQQAVSAHEQAEIANRSVPMMTVAGKDGEVSEVPASEAPQDPNIEAHQKAHQEVEAEAEKAADAAVDALHKGNDKSDTKASDKA